jgi:hypothetical protein
LQFCIAQKHGYLHVTFQTKNQHPSTNENITLRKKREKVENQTMQRVYNVENRKKKSKKKP